MRRANRTPPVGATYLVMADVLKKWGVPMELDELADLVMAVHVTRQRRQELPAHAHAPLVAESVDKAMKKGLLPK